MANVSNEVLLLDARLKQSRATTHPDLSEDDYFLVSSVDTVLRRRSLSHQQIEQGLVDGADDGGIDAVYVFENDSLVEDAEDASANSVGRVRIELEILQVKNERGFKEDALQKLIDHLPLLLQLDSSPAELAKEFNPQVLERFEIFRSTFLRCASRFPELNVSVSYVTKSSEAPHLKVAAKAERLATAIRERFSESEPRVGMVGAADLNTLARERNLSVLSMRVAEGPISSDRGGLVALVGLDEYLDFISDSGGRLRAEIFEENVRDYEGSTVINKAIADSLKADSDIADFWWLNNGITILGRRVQANGKKITIDDPQIVNGLQTSRSVHLHYTSSQSAGDFTKRANAEPRNVLIRAIEAQDDALAARIIKATNSQNRISAASLRATEPFQRDIEEYFLSRGLYYERKKNQYKNQGKHRNKIVELLDLAQSVEAIVLCEPHTARGRPSALVGDLYSKVFARRTKLEAYWNCIQVMRMVDAFLAERSETPTRIERSNVRFQLARAACAFALGSSRPKPDAVASLNASTFTPARLGPVLDWVLASRQQVASAIGVTDTTVLAKSIEWSRDIDRRLSRYTNKVRWPKSLIGPWG